MGTPLAAEHGPGRNPVENLLGGPMINSAARHKSVTATYMRPLYSTCSGRPEWDLRAAPNGFQDHCIRIFRVRLLGRRLRHTGSEDHTKNKKPGELLALESERN